MRSSPQSIEYRGITVRERPYKDKIIFSGWGFEFAFDRGTESGYIMREVMKGIDGKLGRRYNHVVKI